MTKRGSSSGLGKAEEHILTESENPRSRLPTASPGDSRDGRFTYAVIHGLLHRVGCVARFARMAPADPAGLAVLEEARAPGPAELENRTAWQVGAGASRACSPAPPCTLLPGRPEGPAGRYASSVIVDEPVRGRYAYLEHPWLFGLPPHEQIRPFIEREVPLPPIHHLTGLAPVESTPTSSTWSMPASPWWRTAAGLFPGGAIAVVVDAALGTAVFGGLPEGTVLATSELTMNFVRPATPASERLIARAGLIHLGSRQGLSDARIEDARGRLLAHASSRCVLRTLPFDPPDPPTSRPPYKPPDHDSPDPYLRPPEGTVFSQEEWDSTSGLELVRSWMTGDRGTPPVCRLSGWRLLDAGKGASKWSMPASEWFCTGFGTFYGGVIALFLDGAINTALTTTLPAGSSFGTLDLKVNFLRPVTADGRDLVARAQVVHRGRTVAVSTAEIEDADGKRVAMATGSAMILPGVPWNAARPPETLDEAPDEQG